MKMTLEELNITVQNLATVAKKKLPHKLAYAVGRNLMKFQPEQHLIEERKLEIAKHYAERDEAGELIVRKNYYIFEGENVVKFNEEFGEFLKTETEVEIYKVPKGLLEQLENERYDALTPEEYIALDFMVEE